MSAFDAFREEVLGEAAELARELFHGNAEEARAVAAAFVDQSREKLERWARLLAQGDLTRDEFADLVRSQQDLAKLNALLQAGIATQRAAEFRRKLTGAVVTTAFKVLI